MNTQPEEEVSTTKALIPMDEHGMFADMKDVARADSRFVAKMFRKQHKDVLRKIENLGCPADYHRRNFAPISYTDEYGRRQPAYAMTRDGFTLLVMGFTGKRAMQFKIAYINRFNEMEKQIADLRAARMDCPRLTDNVKLLHEHPKAHHYSNELDMINLIVLGMQARKFRELHGIPKGESIRPYLTERQIYLIERLQNADVGLTLSETDYQERKRILTDYKERLEAQLDAKETA